MIARILLLAAFVLACPSLQADTPVKWWSEDVEQALAKAKDNRAELEKALAGVPKDQRPGIGIVQRVELT